MLTSLRAEIIKCKQAVNEDQFGEYCEDPMFRSEAAYSELRKQMKEYFRKLGN